MVAMGRKGKGGISKTLSSNGIFENTSLYQRLRLRQKDIESFLSDSIATRHSLQSG